MNPVYSKAGLRIRKKYLFQLWLRFWLSKSLGSDFSLLVSVDIAFNWKKVEFLWFFGKEDRFRSFAWYCQFFLYYYLLRYSSLTRSRNLSFRLQLQPTVPAPYGSAILFKRKQIKNTFQTCLFEPEKAAWWKKKWRQKISWRWTVSPLIPWWGALFPSVASQFASLTQCTCTLMHEPLICNT